MRTPRSAGCFRAFLRVSWWFLIDFAASSSGVAGVAFGTFVRFWEDGMGAQKSPHEPFFGIVRFVVVSDPFSARFCVLRWFRTDLSDADVIRMQDVGAGIAVS